MTTGQLRAEGVRVGWTGVPASVRAWVDEAVGSPVVAAHDQVGGMSPGCATRLVCADGRRAFVKAVGAALNPRTPELFRHEAAVLAVLPQAAYRAELLGVHDDGDWVALLLEDVEGRHADLSDPRELDAVRDVVEQQAAELAAPPAGLPADSLVLTACRWLDRWPDVASAPERFLPPWAAKRADEIGARLSTLPARTQGDAWCHFDLRSDNLLVRPTGDVVVVDWGMSRRGPLWLDAFSLAFSRVDCADFAHDGADRDLVTDLLLGLAVYNAWALAQPAAPGLPALQAFRREFRDAALTAARPRLG
jgi:aminoglycoside phosphotransferase (APT) family kinase protein